MATPSVPRKKGKALSVNAHIHGLTSICYAIDGTITITAGADGTVNIYSSSSDNDEHPVGAPSNTVQVSKANKAVTALAVTPRGDKFATGCLDHHVKIWNSKSGEFISTFTRFQLPVRCLAFNRTGSLLAAAGDEGTIKIIDLTDPHAPTVAWTCNQLHGGSITSLSFDPTEEGLLASMDSEGTVIISGEDKGWKEKARLPAIAPDSDPDSCHPAWISWQPGSGTFIAVPDRSHQVLFLDRDTFKPMKDSERLSGAHSSNVSLVSWSPNGRYLVTSGEDGQVIVWDGKKGQDIACLKVSAHITGLDWRPCGNSIAMADIEGNIDVWESPVPSHMASPSEGAKRHAGIDRRVIEEFEAEERRAEHQDDAIGDGYGGNHNEVEDDDVSMAEEGTASDEEFNFRGKTAPKKRKIRRIGTLVAEADEEVVDSIQGGRDPLPAVAKKAPKELPEPRSAKQTSPSQPCFQPGATAAAAAGESNRRFLSYDLLGCISTREEQGVCHVDIDFHDSNMGFRMPPMADYYGFTMAALHATAAVFANPKRGDKNPSTLLYRPFTAWAPNSEWSMRFYGEEEVQAVAIGEGWAAASTSSRMLRVFSSGGVQTFVLSLAGSVVSMASHEHLLAVVYRCGAMAGGGNEMLSFSVYDVHKKEQLKAGFLPLSPFSTLTWIGFSENGDFSSFDSKGVLRVLSAEYGGCWVPVFSCAEDRKNSGEVHWMIGLNESHVFVVICKLPETQPQVLPRPVHSMLPRSPQLAISDMAADALERDLLHKGMQLFQAQKSADEAMLLGQEDDDIEDKVISLEAEIDRSILRLIAAACKADKLVRAYELSTRLSLRRSLEGAVRLVSAMRLPALAERLYLLLEEKVKEEEEQQAMAAKPAPEKPPSSLSPPTPELGSRDAVAKTNVRIERGLESALKSNDMEQVKDVMEERVQDEGAGQSLDSLKGKEKKPFSKVANPFAKSGGKEVGEKVGLFDSLKQMQDEQVTKRNTMEGKNLTFKMRKHTNK